MARRKAERTQALTQPVAPEMSQSYETLVATIAQAHDHAQRQAVQAINVALTLRNWLIGYRIVEYEQHGSDRAQYGERLLDELARDLRRRITKGFTKRYLELFRQFYLRYPIAKSLISQLGISLPSSPSVPFTPFEWQDNAYFARLFRELPWTHFISMATGVTCVRRRLRLSSGVRSSALPVTTSASSARRMAHLTPLSPTTTAPGILSNGSIA